MKKLITAFCLLMGATGAYAFKPFVNLGVGGAIVPYGKVSNYDVIYVPDDLGNKVMGVSKNTGSNTMGANFGVGAMINNYFGIEAEYFYLKDVKSSAQGKIKDFDAHGIDTLTTKANAQSLVLLLDVPLPMDKAFYITGKAGVANINIERTHQENNYFNDEDDSQKYTKVDNVKGLGLSLGFGAGYHLTPQLDLQATYDFLGTVFNGESLQYASAGLNYKF